MHNTTILYTSNDNPRTLKNNRVYCVLVDYKLTSVNLAEQDTCCQADGVRPVLTRADWRPGTSLPPRTSPGRHFIVDFFERQLYNEISNNICCTNGKKEKIANQINPDVSPFAILRVRDVCQNYLSKIPAGGLS